MAEDVLNLLLGTVNFLIKVDAYVVDHEPVLVTHVSLSQLFVLVHGLGHRLVAGFVIQRCVKLLSTIGSCHHMQDCIVAVVSHHDHIHVEVVHEGLPFGATHVGRTIEESPIDKDDDRLVSDHLANLEEALLERNLQAHQSFLEEKSLLLRKS